MAHQIDRRALLGAVPAAVATSAKLSRGPEPAAAATIGTVTTIVEPNDEIRAADIAAGGRFVLFRTSSTDILPGANWLIEDLYLWDALEESMTAITRGDHDSDRAVISADGRWVTFGSFAGNLVLGDSNLRGDIFRWDRLGPTTTRVQSDAALHSYLRTASANGSTLAYTLVNSEGQEQDSFLLRTGTRRRLPHLGFRATIDAGGRFLTYDEKVSGVWTLRLWDRLGSTVRDVLRPDPEASFGQVFAYAISGNGRFVALSTSIRGLPLAAGSLPEPAAGPDLTAVFVWDRLDGRFRVASGAISCSCTGLDISHDGRFVAFTGKDGSLWRWDRLANRYRALTSGFSCIDVSITADGRQVALIGTRVGGTSLYGGLHLWRDPVLN